MKFSHLERLLREWSLGTVAVPSDFVIKPGPINPDSTPGRLIIVQSYGGPGEDLEGVLDQVSWQVRVIGRQNDYTDAEDVALQIDKSFLEWHSGYMFDGGPWLAGIQRVGGAPSPLLLDDADRTHFGCSYIFSVELALAN